MKLVFHCFWTGLLSLHHVLCLSSLIHTQENEAEIWFWTFPAEIERAESYFKQYCDLDQILVKAYNPTDEARNTMASQFPHLLRPADLAHLSDVFRLLVLHNYGGVYFDLDILFMHEFVSLAKSTPFLYRWESQRYCNTALMSLPYPRHPIAQHFLRRAVEKQTFLPMQVFALNECHEKGMLVFRADIFDPVWVTHEPQYQWNNYCNTFEDFFLKTMPDDFVVDRDFFPQCAAYHWHNQWTTPTCINPNSIASAFVKKYVKLQNH
jgi:hypothetical protein